MKNKIIQNYVPQLKEHDMNLYTHMTQKSNEINRSNKLSSCYNFTTKFNKNQSQLNISQRIKYIAIQKLNNSNFQTLEMQSSKIAI